MNAFNFDLQRFAWTQVSDNQWRYTSGTNGFYLNGDFSADEDDNGNLTPQNVSVSGNNVTIEPDWTESISITGGSFNFVDDYESFEAHLYSGDQATNNDNSNWNVAGTGYVFYNYAYYDSDVTVNNLEAAPSGKMTTTITEDTAGFQHISVNINGAELSNFSEFLIDSLLYRSVSVSGDVYNIIPHITQITLTPTGLVFTDYNNNEISYEDLDGRYAVYDVNNNALSIIDGAAYFDDSNTLEITVEGVSLGLKIVGDSFVAFASNGDSVSINTETPMYYNISDSSWVWDGTANTLYFDTNTPLTGISNVGANTTFTFNDSQITITGAVLTDAAIDGATITGTDLNPNNGYIINIIDGGASYEFVEDLSTTPVIANIIYSTNRAFTFLDTDGNIIPYSEISEDFTTLDGGIVLGQFSPLNITIASGADDFSIFDVTTDNYNLVAKLNTGDVFIDDHIAIDANETNAWRVLSGNMVGLGANSATEISGISVDSTTSIVRSGDLIIVNNATIENGAVNGNAISGTDDDPSDGYYITISGDNVSFVEIARPTLASIHYSDTFYFFDTEGNTINSLYTSNLVTTGSRAITLGADVPDNVTVSSGVDNFVIYNVDGLRAKINTGDVYSNYQIVRDYDETNAWVAVGNQIVIGQNEVTIEGLTVTNATSIIKENNLILIEGATLENGSVNGAAISGTDSNPDDGYFITLTGEGAAFLNFDQTLASIFYNGSYTFIDHYGNAMLSDYAQLFVTVDGDSITLGADTPANVTISSDSDNLKIYNGSTLIAKINAGDQYFRGAITADEAPTNSWIISDNTLTLGRDEVTIQGITVNGDSSVVKENDYITIYNATLSSSARINDTEIIGTDRNPHDGYQITLTSSGWTHIQSTVSPWTSTGSGFIYSSDDAYFTLSGSNVIDGDGNGEPDNISVSVVDIDPFGSVMIIDGLNGEVYVNGNNLGVSGDENYAAGFILNDGDMLVDSFANVSPGATINAAGTIIYTDGDGAYTFGDGAYTINNTPIYIDNNGAVLTFDIENGTISAVENLQGGAILDGVGDASLTVTGAVVLDGIGYATDDPDGIVISGSTITGLNENSMLQISRAGSYVVNSTPLYILSSSAVLGGANAESASLLQSAEVTARNALDIPSDASFISAEQVRATVAALGTNWVGDGPFDGDKIVELNDLNENVVLDFDRSSGRKFVMIDGGANQRVIFNDESVNGLYITAEATGNKTIDAGDAGDVLLNRSTAANVTLKGGSGNDSIVAAGGANEIIDLSSGGVDTIFTSNGAILRNYDPSSGGGVATSIEASDVIDAIENKTISLGDGEINIEGVGNVKVEGVDQSTAINLIAPNGNSTRLVFANREGVEFGASDEEINELLYSDLSDLTINGGTGNDTIVSGANNVVNAGEGDDTIYGGANNLIDGGAGDDVISLRAEDSSSGVKMSAGRDTVENFTAGWSSISDRLIFDENNATFVFRGNDLRVDSDEGAIVVPTIKGDGSTKILQSATEYETPSKVVLIEENSTYKIENSSDMADRYIGLGANAGVDLSNVTDDQTVDLNNGAFENISRVTLGSGRNYVEGTPNDDTIAAGIERSQIYGYGGNDYLIANTSDEKQEGSTFVYTAGLDTIEGFETSEHGTADSIFFAAQITTVESFGNDVVIEAGATDQLTVMDVVDKQIMINGALFKIGENVTQQYGTTGYIGTGYDATLTADNGGNVWLNGAEGTFYDNIRTLDATGAVTNSVLVGNSYSDNVIYGGTGDNSLWGSTGGDDTLVGGLGHNEFFYLYGDGRDVITDAREDDVIRLLNIGDGEIDWANRTVTSRSIMLRFTDGGSLTVRTQADVTFELGDGTRRSVDRTSGEWYRRS